MHREEVMAKVVQAVSQVQKISGRSAGNLGSTTRPIRDLAGFDSLSGIEATIELSELLGHEFPDDYNAFVSKDGRSALSVHEIAEEICSGFRGVPINE